MVGGVLSRGRYGEVHTGRCGFGAFLLCCLPAFGGLGGAPQGAPPIYSFSAPRGAHIPACAPPYFPF